MAPPMSPNKKEGEAKKSLALPTPASTPVKKRAGALLRSSRNEKHLLVMIWNMRHMFSTVFTSLDIEYNQNKGLIFELGLATKFAPTGSDIVARHIIVDESIRLRKRRIKSFPFGHSQHVPTQKDLVPILDQHFSDLLARYNTTVFCGHSIMSDLNVIQEVLGWTLPVIAPVLDTQHIWYGLMGTDTASSSDNSLEQLLQHFKIQHHPSNLHNAGSDALYTIKLLLRKAEEAALGDEAARGGVQLVPSTGDCGGCDGQQRCPWKELYLRVFEAAQPLLSLLTGLRERNPGPMAGNNATNKRILEKDSDNPSNAPKRRKIDPEDNKPGTPVEKSKSQQDDEEEKCEASPGGQT